MGNETERVRLNYDEAVAMLDDGETIHALRPGLLMIGCDWSRTAVLKCIKTYGAQLSGKVATRMGHGVCTVDEVGPVFFETKDNAET
jgi:hypothetical protein